MIGVMPPAFKFAPFWATRAELWAPLAFGERIHNRDSNSLRVFARLKPGVTVAQARADIRTITGRLERRYPGTNTDIVLAPLKENVVGKVETPLLVLLGAVGFVLLIACANVAHMLLARTSDRQKEIAVRTALGAERARIIRQFLTENLLLAAIGASAGLLLAVLGTKALVLLSPAKLPRVEMVAMDGRVMLFLVGVTLLTALVFGLAPAMHAAIGNLSNALKEGGRGGSDGIHRDRLRSFLVASEFALAFMLLIGAGLMIRSFSALQSVDPGFNPHHVLSIVVSVAGSNEVQTERRALFYRQLLEHVRALPGVESAGVMSYAVARRTHEIGIRISLGASRADVLRMVVRQGMMQALAGTAAGVAGALLLARLMAGMLYGVRPTDPVTFGGVAAVLGLAALAASCVPARKATRIDPMVALRHE